MNKNKFNEDRLQRFAEYLKKGDMQSQKLFNYNTNKIVVQYLKNDEQLKPLFFLPILELPIIFDKDWYYNEHYIPVCKNSKEQNTVLSVIEYFGINRSIFQHLFVCGKQRTEIWGGIDYPAKPKVSDVATNVEELIDHLNYYSTINNNEFKIFLN